MATAMQTLRYFQPLQRGGFRYQDSLVKLFVQAGRR